jgi:mRNA interferase RelE/StbE
MLHINLSIKAQSFLAKIPRKHAEQITRKIDQLAAEPSAVPSKQLKGYPQFHRIRAGEYRIIYRIENDVLMLHIVRIGKRNDGEVYERLDAL